MPRSPAKSLTSTAASPPDTSRSGEHFPQATPFSTASVAMIGALMREPVTAMS